MDYREKLARLTIWFGVFLISMFVAYLIFVVIYVSRVVAVKVPIESTRKVILTCTVKSNIDGVITLNDDCKITVIGEE